MPGSNGSARLLSRTLSLHGFASLRYDKLGSGSTGVPESYLDPDFTFGKEDYLAGLAGALDTLRAKAGADTPVFVAGHSEGGLWALELARQNPGLFRGVILLATAGRSQCDLVVEQLDAQLQGFELSTAQREQELDRLQAALDHVASHGAAPPEDRLPGLPGLKSVVHAYANPRTIGITQWLCGVDPVTLLPENGQNLLILQGGYDQQVDAETDGQRLHRGSPGSTIRVAPQADHVLKRLDLDGQPLNMLHALKYNQDGRVLDPILVEALLQWLEDRVVPDAKPPESP
ncbi:MAG: alpha/beta fold hydrolase [Myxococcota bacterium]|nr:alpha/beta fold hydrolase [Myxococcota bacterium]